MVRAGTLVIEPVEDKIHFHQPLEKAESQALHYAPVRISQPYNITRDCCWREQIYLVRVLFGFSAVAVQQITHRNDHESWSIHLNKQCHGQVVSIQLLHRGLFRRPQVLGTGKFSELCLKRRHFYLLRSQRRTAGDDYDGTHRRGERFAG